MFPARPGYTYKEEEDLDNYASDLVGEPFYRILTRISKRINSVQQANDTSSVQEKLSLQKTKKLSLNINKVWH